MVFNLCLSFLILIEWMLTPVHVQVIPLSWQSTVNLSSIGFQFSPIDVDALLLLESTATSITACARMCHSTALCRIFDYDNQSDRCRIFEGDIATMGSLIVSLYPNSRVGSMQLNPQQFINLGYPCSFCLGSRYLACINATCQCPPRTYFDGSICQSQKLLGAQCGNSTECRNDRNYTCLPRQQCGPLSLQSGTTAGGYGNGMPGNALNALYTPLGITLDNSSSIYVSDFSNNRVIKLQEGSLVGSIVSGNGVSGSSVAQLNGPGGVYVDGSSNIYVSDSWNYRVMLWRKNSSFGVRVAGSGFVGSSLNNFNTIDAIILDSLGNMYISDPFNHRVLKWARNATSGVLQAGIGVAGNSSQQLNSPYGLYLDESNSYLYIADTLNHRIQRYQLGNTMNGTTVAGGNGQGIGSHQLNTPSGVFISKNNGAIYIADYGNHRVQRWSPGATNGVTIAGVAGSSGSSATLLNGPYETVLSANETYLYVTDRNNHRVQRFMLI